MTKHLVDAASARTNVLQSQSSARTTIATTSSSSWTSNRSTGQDQDEHDPSKVSTRSKAKVLPILHTDEPESTPAEEDSDNQNEPLPRAGSSNWRLRLPHGRPSSTSKYEIQERNHAKPILGATRSRRVYHGSPLHPGASSRTDPLSSLAKHHEQDHEPRRHHRQSLHPDTAWRHLLATPSSHFWVMWNLLHLLALGYICTVVPYLSALPQYSVSWSGTMNRAIDLFYILDVLVNFRACYVDDETGQVVTDARQIALHYVTSSPSWFAFDIVLAFPFDLVLRDNASHSHGSSMAFTFVRVLRLLHLAKLLRVLKLRPLLDYCEDEFGVSRHKLVVVQLLLTIVLVAHLTACGFILAAIMDSSSQSWIQRNDLTHAPATEIYVAALYWAFTMMTTVGFGDIVPVTLIERCYAIMAMVISAGTYAYVIANMASLVALMNVQQSRYDDKINELNAYLSSRHVPPSLQKRTRQFYRFYLAKKSVFDEQALCEALPRALREELADHHVTRAMRRVKLFQQLGDDKRGFASHIALTLHPVFFQRNHLVVKASDPAGEMYFIIKGHFQVLRPDSQAFPSPPRSPVRRIASLVSSGRSPDIVATLQDGDFFGEMALLCHDQDFHRCASVRSTAYCELYSLGYESLSPALTTFPAVKQLLTAEANTRRLMLESRQRPARHLEQATTTAH